MKKTGMTDEEFIAILEGKNPRYTEEDVNRVAEEALMNVLKQCNFDDES